MIVGVKLIFASFFNDNFGNKEAVSKLTGIGILDGHPLNCTIFANIRFDIFEKGENIISKLYLLFFWHVVSTDRSLFVIILFYAEKDDATLSI